MSTKNVRVLVLVCSTRPGALGPAVGRWLVETVGPRTAQLGAELVSLSLSELSLPFLDEEDHPSAGVYTQEHTKRWSALVDAADGFVVVTPEYNHGMPATLKNALDYLGREWAWKPIGFVSYGNTSSGTRSVQHAKQVVTALRLVPLGSTVALRIGEAVDGGRVRPPAAAAESAVRVLDELVRAANALRPMREIGHTDHQTGPLPGSYLRRLAPQDSAEVLALQRCCWVDEALANDTLAVPALHESLEQVREWLGTWTTSGLWQDGRLLGMVRTLRADDDLHVGRLGVVPDLRGRGVGRWLLRAAEATAEPGCVRTVLHTGARSRRNLSFYHGEGYRSTSAEGADGVVRLTKDVTRQELSNARN